ncbi:hypothetical protein PDESU_03666 [Pontiella desulfatans]|uniref:Fibronectin type-III domain-containing protein n=1 Tax=Pontiella desulfatans TaxID=2750659 RepID=A0A6C2U6S0_PONDE|nr:fibronectin type III domain-containing protein [Pontiella desulfatans]VGO15086.1 hypothetical protein PDESU_03666 [Pontiella desulfatans]
MNKKMISLMVVIALLTFGAQAVLVIDNTFTNVAGTDLPIGDSNNLDPNDELDNGWYSGPISDTEASFDPAADQLTIGPAASIYDSLKAFGQMNTDNKVTTGLQQFLFDVAAVTLGGGETISFSVQVFGSDLVTAGQDWKGIDLNGSNNHAHWTSLGTVSTPAVTAAGTHVTGSVDLGDGYNMLAFKILCVDNGSAGYGDTITLDGISAAPVSVSSAPDAPTNLTATAASTSAINLSWADASSNEDGFYIERGADTNSFAVIATNAANTTVYADSGLTDSTEYWYRVSAFNTIGTSSNNPVASATTLVPTPPNAPTNLVVEVLSATSLFLEWTDLSSDEDGFKIERKSGAGSFAQITNVAADVTTLTDSELISGTLYTYRVFAYNGAGNSGYSNEESAVPENIVFSTNVVFNGTSDSVLMAAGDTSNVVLISSAGTHTLTNSSGSDQIAYIFGNFAGTALTNTGDSVVLSFRVSNMPDNAVLRFGLAGARDGALHTTNVPNTDFARAYAAYGIEKIADNISTFFYKYNGGPANVTTEDRDVLNFTTLGLLGNWDSAGNPDRFNNDSTADFTLTLTREATAFSLSGTMDVAGGTGVQQMDSIQVIPVDNDMALTDAFTTFAIGCAGLTDSALLDSGTALTVSEVTVAHLAREEGGSGPIIPPPASTVSLSSLGGGQDVIHWTTAQGSGYVYSVWYSTNLLAGFQPLETNLADTVQSLTNTIGTSPVFYKIEAK